MVHVARSQTLVLADMQHHYWIIFSTLADRDRDRDRFRFRRRGPPRRPRYQPQDSQGEDNEGSEGVSVCGCVCGAQCISVCWQFAIEWSAIT